MKDPLDAVDPELKAWVTPELVAALAQSVRNTDTYRNIRIQLVDRVAIRLDRTTESPNVGKYHIAIDPTQPWPPQPVFEFGDRVTTPDGRTGVVVGTDTPGNIIIATGDTYAHPPADLTPGWPNENLRAANDG